MVAQVPRTEWETRRDDFRRTASRFESSSRRGDSAVSIHPVGGFSSPGARVPSSPTRPGPWPGLPRRNLSPRPLSSPHLDSDNASGAASFPRRAPAPTASRRPCRRRRTFLGEGSSRETSTCALDDLVRDRRGLAARRALRLNISSASATAAAGTLAATAAAARPCRSAPASLSAADFAPGRRPAGPRTCCLAPEAERPRRGRRPEHPPRPSPRSRTRADADVLAHRRRRRRRRAGRLAVALAAAAGRRGGAPGGLSPEALGGGGPGRSRTPPPRESRGVLRGVRGDGLGGVDDEGEEGVVLRREIRLALASTTTANGRRR